MNHRRTLLAAIGAGALAPLASLAQQGKVWRIGLLDLGSRETVLADGRLAALKEGLREFGYVEGKNAILEARHAEGRADRLDALAAELVGLKVDVILAQGNPASHAARRATATIPIVITNAIDPVGDGFAKTLARPGGNMTGMSSGAEDIVQKQFELLTLIVPKMKRIATVSNTVNTAHASLHSLVQAAARGFGIQVTPVNVRSPEEIESSFAAMARDRVDAVMIFIDAFLGAQRKQIAGLALKHHLPSIYSSLNYPEVGGLISYGTDIVENWRRAGIFVNKIFKGTRAGDIPFEQPTRYYLLVNRKTARSLGLQLPSTVLGRADKVIE